MTTPQPIEFEKPVSNGAATPTVEIALLDGPAIAASLPDLAYLVREIGLVADAGPPHLVAGYGYSGKTLAMQSLALSLTAARPVWGFYSCRDARRVVHVDYEQGERLTRIRYKRLARAMGVDLASLGDAIALTVMPPIKLAREHASHWHRLMAGRDLIIVDSLRAATSGEDENSSQIRGALDMLGEVSERTGCRALVIHHARKPSEDAPAGGRFAIRGSSAIYDASDSAYVLSANKGDAIRVAHERAKSHGETVEDFALVISDVAMDGDPKAGLALRVHGAELIAQQRGRAEREKAQRDAATIRAALSQSHHGMSTMELRDRTGISGERFSRALAALGEAVVTRQEKRGKTRPSNVLYLRGKIVDDGGQKADRPPSQDDGPPLIESAIFSRPMSPGSEGGSHEA